MTEVHLKIYDEGFADGKASASAENKQLRAAAERVCWFDWSHNDEDAARAVDDLRKLVSTGEQSS